MHSHCACHKGVQIVHGQIEDRQHAHLAAIQHLKRESRQRQRFLLYAVTLRHVRLPARAKWREPLSRSDLAEQLDGRGKAAGISMKRLKLARGRLWQSLEA